MRSEELRDGHTSFPYEIIIAHCTLHISLGEVLVKVGIDEAADPIGDKDDKGDQTDKQDNR